MHRDGRHAPATAPASRARSPAAWARHRLALVVDPRFPGGTSGAVAAEIRALGPVFDLTVHALETAMFEGRRVHDAIQAALDEQAMEVVWDASVVRADTIVLHNPSCLRFDVAFRPRLSCSQAFVVTHENFLRPGGVEAFDVAHVLGLIDRATVGGTRRLAPVSAYNRGTVVQWMQHERSRWRTTEADWQGILDLDLVPPNPSPRDRRGRHSRPGLEKFPPPEVMHQQFPPHAEACIILGGDVLLADPQAIPRHWDVRRFGAGDVRSFLAEIDFLVYFTHPLWRESFGRAIAEAIAAGKVVITDAGTASSFGGAVVAARDDEVDGIIEGFVVEPERYTAFVRQAQARLAGFGPQPFVETVRSEIEAAEAARAALV